MAQDERALADPARIVLQRTVGWSDTDASGHYQFQTVFRWLMEAESELHERLGIADETHGSSPRLHVEADYLLRLWFRDRVDFELRVDEVGRSSLRYVFEVRKAKDVAARGVLVVAYMPREAERPQPWPPNLRKALSEGGKLG
ncbi:MAG TPA: thioesterase family protein [Candidatus Dormibacteraeota bacterium]|nr:thioesterase family protein [Candidatus Dormibacteraeota bacterium]